MISTAINSVATKYIKARFVTDSSALVKSSRKNTGIVKCNPPNVRCHGRCIPPTWSCRREGGGTDSHTRAVKYDPVKGLSSLIRGSKDFIGGAASLNVERFSRGKNGIVRGIVKLNPEQDYQKKEQFKDGIEGFIIPAASVILLGMVAGGAHVGLKKTNLFNYRSNFGANIDDIASNAIYNVQNLNPGIRAGRISVKRGSRTAFSDIAKGGIRGRRQADLFTSTTPRSSNAFSGKRPLDAQANRVFSSVDKAFATQTKPNYDDWLKAKSKAVVGLKRGGRSAYTENATSDYLASQFRLKAPSKGGFTPLLLRTQLESNFSRNQFKLREGFKLAKLDYTKAIDRETFFKSNKQIVARQFTDLTPEGKARALSDAYEDFTSTVIRSPKTNAALTIKRTESYFDNYFEELTAAVEHPASRSSFAKTAYVATARNLPSTKGAGVISPAHANLLNRAYFNRTVLQQKLKPVVIKQAEAVKLASQMAGFSISDPDEALQLLRSGVAGSRSYAAIPSLEFPAPPKPRTRAVPPRKDAADEPAKDGKPCGKSFIGKNEKCSKATSTAHSNDPSVVKAGATMAGALALIAAGGFLYSRIKGARGPISGAEWRSNPNNLINKPRLSNNAIQKINKEAIEKGEIWNVQTAINDRRKEALAIVCKAKGFIGKAIGGRGDAYEKARAGCGEGAYGLYFVHPSKKYGVKKFKDEGYDNQVLVDDEFDNMGAARLAKVNVPEPVATNYTKESFDGGGRSHTLTMTHMDGYKPIGDVYGGGRSLPDVGAPLIARLQVLREFKKLHLEGISHGDIHGGNVLINPRSKKAAIIDFGYSRTLQQMEHQVTQLNGVENLRGDLINLPRYVGVSKHTVGYDVNDTANELEWLRTSRGMRDNIEKLAEEIADGNGYDAWDKYQVGIRRYYDFMERDLLSEVSKPRSKFIKSTTQLRITGLNREVVKAVIPTDQRKQLLLHKELNKERLQELAKKAGLKEGELAQGLRPEAKEVQRLNRTNNTLERRQFKNTKAKEELNEWWWNNVEPKHNQRNRFINQEYAFLLPKKGKDTSFGSPSEWVD